MGQFSADLFLRLAKDADDHKMLDGIEYDDSSFGEGSFGDTGQDQIEKFKNAVFMVLMMRAREYMVETRQSQLCADQRQAYASFGIKLIDSDVHPGERPKDQAFVKKMMGGIGSKTDSFHLDDAAMSNCVKALFTGPDGTYDPIVSLACTKSS